MVSSASEEERVSTQVNFYRDRFDHVLFALLLSVLVLFGLIGVGVYLFFDKPHPITVFTQDNEWRVVGAVPLDQPYVSDVDLLQWVSNSFPRSFLYDFLRMDQQLDDVKKTYTAEGWKVFLMQANNVVQFDKVKAGKLFVSAFATRAPFVVRNGLSQGRRAWLVEIPVSIEVNGGQAAFRKEMTFHVLVVRVPTTTNLAGIAIHNIVVKSKSDTTAIE